MKRNVFDNYEEEQAYWEDEAFRQHQERRRFKKENDPKAGESLDIAESLAGKRANFRLEDLLPNELARACAVMQQSLPVDTLSTLMPLLAGYSGLLKLGTRVAKSHDFHVPCNLYVALVCISGGGKSPTKQRLIDLPASDIKTDQSNHYKRLIDQWRREEVGKSKSERMPEPVRYMPHLTDITPAALTQHLVNSEELKLGQLLIRDELSGLLAAVEVDTKSGSGTGEAQFLEAYDGAGYYSIRVEAGSRCYESCHLSVYGNIQPEALRQLVNGDDSKGKFARFLFVHLPTRVVTYQDDDPTEEELATWRHAESVLKDYASRLFKEPPRHYRLSQEARRYFNRWWEEHQRRINLPFTPPVIRSLLGKASANALRVAGLLHLMRVVAKEVEPHSTITATTAVHAINIVDQLLAETEAFHEEEDTPQLRLMRHIHAVSWNNGQPIWIDQQKARDTGGRAMKKEKVCTAEKFKDAALQLQMRGYGETVSNGRRMDYQATRAMAS